MEFEFATFVFRDGDKEYRVTFELNKDKKFLRTYEVTIIGLCNKPLFILTDKHPNKTAALRLLKQELSTNL